MADDTTHLTALTADIVGAFVGNNAVAMADLPRLIRETYAALASAGNGTEAAGDDVEKPTAAQIRKSITPDALISFIDGKPYKSIKRHLTTHGLTVEDYKAKYGLPRDYPTVAPSYSEARSKLAKSMGLGQGGRRGKANAAAPKGRAKKA